MSLSQQFSPLVVCDGFHLIYSANYTVHDTKSGISTRNSTFEILPITFTSYFETCTGILQPVTCIDKLRRIIIANGCILGIVEEKHPDIILLGPQVKYLFDETKKRFDERIPVMLISQEDYGMMDGEKVLKKALLLLQKRKRGEL